MGSPHRYGKFFRTVTEIFSARYGKCFRTWRKKRLSALYLTDGVFYSGCFLNVYIYFWHNKMNNLIQNAKLVTQMPYKNKAW